MSGSSTANDADTTGLSLSSIQWLTRWTTFAHSVPQVTQGDDDVAKDECFCAWCHEPAERLMELEPAKYKGQGTKRRMTKAPIKAHACALHIAMIQRNRQEKEEAAARRRASAAAMRRNVSPSR